MPAALCVAVCVDVAVGDALGTTLVVPLPVAAALTAAALECEPDPVAVALSVAAPEAPSTALRVAVAVPAALCVEAAVGGAVALPVALGVGAAGAPGKKLAVPLPVAEALANPDAATDCELVGVNELAGGRAQRPPTQERPSEHTGRNARRVQCAPTAGHAPVTTAPPQLINGAAPLLLVTVNAASAAHAAALAPWQARLCGLHEYPSLQSVAARGASNEEPPEPPPARAKSHELHAGAAVMPSALAAPK